MVQDDDGYIHDHVAATFHAAHYYRLIGEETPKAEAMLKRVLRDQKADGSWMLNPPSRDRHATFDAAFILRQLGGDRPEAQSGAGRRPRSGRCRAATRTAGSATSPAARPTPTRASSRSARW